jgi:signal transduction histidine kinase
MADERTKVLVIEDDEGLARLQTRRLERAGYAVVHATTAAEGLEQVRQGGIDLIVLDQRLPGGASGLELYEQLKAAGYEVPAILVTGFQADELVLQALRAGIRDFVPKNDEFLDYLVPAIARVLRQVTTERDLMQSRARAKEARERQEQLEQEIHERKRAEEALKEADRRKDEFLATLAHELRNPLAPVRNALNLLRLAGQNQEIVVEASQMIERQVDNLVRLVDDLLDVSRITRGKINLQKEPVDLATVVARAIESSQPLIDARKHTLDVKLPTAPLLVEGDPMRLAQVLLNLLNNAAKYTPEGGRIWLAAERADAIAVLRVRDTGLGLRQEMLPKVFDLFTQAERTLDRSEGGLGLGLTLVRRLTELHGGTVEAFSDGPGQGSEFVIRLPLLVGTPPPGLEKHAATSGQALFPSAHRILIVDDNRDAAESLAMLLRMLDNDVRTAHDGRRALEVAATYRPDVVLLDIGLPGMSGLDICRRLREQHTGGQQPLIAAMTGYGQEEDRRRSQEAGFNVHLVKPVDLNSLREVLARPESVGRAREDARSADSG